MEKLRYEMYDVYQDTNDPQKIVDISQKLDRLLNQFYFSKSPKKNQ
ncbi:aspartyl-phosphate phosphatase Spo0E family protein [Amphibacillus jilinensis]